VRQLGDQPVSADLNDSLIQNLKEEDSAFRLPRGIMLAQP
jgi:hypothetical protein